MSHSDEIRYHLYLSIKRKYLYRCFGILQVVLPLPKCLHTRASPRIIWPHRNIHPHPVSDVGPVPPVTRIIHEIPLVTRDENQVDSNLKTHQG